MTKKEISKWCKEHPVLTGIFSVALIITLFAMFSDGEHNASSDMKIGEQSIYDSIDTTIDCDTLQNVYNIAMDNVERRQPGDELRKVSLSYATYTNTRMNNLGC